MVIFQFDIFPAMFSKTLKKLIVYFFVFLALAVVGWAQERLILIGGGKRPAAAMKRFIEWSGADKGEILVIAWASGEPQASADAVKKEIAGLSENKIRIEIAPFAPLNEKTRAALLSQIKSAGGFFFTGGDQSRIMDVLRDEELLKLLKEKYRQGAVFGGTSAGLAIMSAIMITGEGDFTVIDGAKVETRSGLGLLPDAIVDQHFIKRQRQNRLFGLILKNSSLLGVGVDENTAFLVQDNRFGEVLGDSQVMILDVPPKKDFMKVFILKPGEKFDLRKRRRLSK